MTNLQYDVMCDMYPNFKDCTIQLFDDNKNRKDTSLAKKVDISKFDNDVVSDTLKKYNDKGAGIFFSVNSMQPGKRDKDSVTHINAWICECDDFTKEEQMDKIKDCPLPPSLIIESNKSYHMYRFAKDGKIENRNKICRGLCNHFGGDPQVVEVSRVLRVPGFNHMKNPNEPFMCEIVDGSGEYYTEEQMLNAYQDTTSAQERKEEERRLQEHKKRMEKYKLESDGARYNINGLDAMQMLEEISGHRMVNGEHFSFRRNGSGYQISVNGRESGAWIDRNGLIGSNSNGGPTWVNWVKWYKIYDDKEIYQWVKDNHPECIPEKKVEKKAQDYKEIISSEDDDEDLFMDYEYKQVDFSSVVPFTWGLDCLDNKFGRIDYGKFIAAVGESGAGKTTYTFFQALQNAEYGNKVCYISLEQDPGELLLLKSLKRYGVTKSERDNKTVSESQQKAINEMMKDLATKKNLRITKVNNPTLPRLCKAIIKAKEDGYYLFYIDNLGIILSDKGMTKEYDMVTESSRVFMTLAHNEGVTIILLHHFNQGNSISRYAPRTLADIRGGAKLEHDSDLVFQVRRDLDFENKGNQDSTSIIVQKNRQWGTVGSVDIKFNKGGYEELGTSLDNPL